MATEAPRSHSPDIELGPHASQSGLIASPQSSQRGEPLPVPGPTSRLPTYSSYDPALQHAHIPSTPSHLPSSLPPPTIPETDPSMGFAHPNTADGNYGDPSDKLFSLYLAQADKFDKEQSESWKGDTEGILVFTGLFSATVATFIIESYKQLQSDSNNTTVLLLAQISQQLAALSSGTPFSIPSGLPGQPFHPSASAVRVNTLWFLSLVLSLTCALLATLMQQWVRRYLQASRPWYAPYKRARIRTFFAEGVERFGLPRAVEALPALLHTSVFLFFAGLVDFLININHTVAFSLLSAVAAVASAYFLFTTLPLVYPNSPYQTPLTAVLWIFQQATLLVSLDVTRRVVKLFYERTGLVAWKLYGRVIYKLDGHSRRLAQGFARSREAISLRQPTKMDSRGLSWALDALDEDRELEEFVAAMPGYYRSTIVRPADEALEYLTHHEGLDSPLEARILDLLCPRGTAPDAPPTSAKERKRRMVCLEALYCLPWTIRRRLHNVGSVPSLFASDPFFSSPEAWVVATSMAKDINGDLAFLGHCVSAVLIATWRPSFVATPGPPGGSSDALAQHLSVPEGVVQTWMHHPGSVMLASLIHLLENTLEDLRVRDSADSLPVGVHTDRALSRNHEVLHVALGIVNKFDPSRVAQELLEAFVALFLRVERLELEARERGYRSRGLEMVLRRMLPVLDRIPRRDHGTG